MDRFVLHTCLWSLAFGLSACAARMPPDIGRDWQPVNRYSPVAHEIPLQRPYVFQPSPMDGTLKGLISRWASDSGMALSYQHPSDFTLFQAVQSIHTTSVQQAAAELTRLYAAHRVVVEVQDSRLLVTQEAHPVAAPAMAFADADPDAGRANPGPIRDLPP